MIADETENRNGETEGRETEGRETEGRETEGAESNTQSQEAIESKKVTEGRNQEERQMGRQRGDR
jgi:hypothetical protein